MDNATIVKYYTTTPYFKICNPNPTAEGRKGWRWDKPDCVIRALANSTNVSWVEAYDFLSGKARRDFTIPNDGVRFRSWLIENGAKWTACKAEKGKKRMTAKEFAESHKSGRYIITLASHECACVDGVLLDTWNCGLKCVVGYIDMSNFKMGE